MLSRDESAEKKVNEAEAIAKDTKQKLIDSQLRSVGLERTLEDLKDKMT